MIHLLNPGVLQFHKQQKCFLLPSTSKIKICSTLCIPFYVHATINAHECTTYAHKHTMHEHTHMYCEGRVFARMVGISILQHNIQVHTEHIHLCAHNMYTHMHTAIHLLTYTETHTLLLHCKFMD